MWSEHERGGRFRLGAGAESASRRLPGDRRGRRGRGRATAAGRAGPDADGGVGLNAPGVGPASLGEDVGAARGSGTESGRFETPSRFLCLARFSRGQHAAQWSLAARDCGSPAALSGHFIAARPSRESSINLVPFSRTTECERSRTAGRASSQETRTCDKTNACASGSLNSARLHQEPREGLSVNALEVSDQMAELGALQPRLNLRRRHLSQLTRGQFGSPTNQRRTVRARRESPGV